MSIDKAIHKFSQKETQYRCGPPHIVKGVIPTESALVQDSVPYDIYGELSYSDQFGTRIYFPGFIALASLSTIAEYRALAATISSEIVRKGIEITSSSSVPNLEKIQKLTEEVNRLNLMSVIQKAAWDDCVYGRGQIFLDIQGSDVKSPLIIDPRTIEKGSFKRIKTLEATWIAPGIYNATNPTKPDFYVPEIWFVLGEQIHHTRILNIITRPLPDILKPVFSFAGLSLFQMTQPSVENWLQTRKSISNLIDSFSTTVLATDMSQVLSGDDDGTGLLKRTEFFTKTRSNRGMMLLDKEREELVQVNTPLGGLHELQAQAQEHMCSVSRIPAVILTGISPSGLNATSEGEIRVFYDWISSQQETFWRSPIQKILEIIQISLFGEIDHSISFKFNPLYQLTDKELAEMRESEQRIDVGYMSMGVLDPSEVRKKLASDPSSGYNGIDVLSTSL